MARYGILSLDGGGIRGILAARLLERIEASRPGLIASVRLFAGTSTGSVLAVGLAKGLSPTELVALYRTRGPKIFHASVAREVASLGSLIGAKYTDQARLDNLRPYFDGILLDDLLPRNVLIATVQLDSRNENSPDLSEPRRWKAKFFHNYPGPQSDGKQKALDVILRSSAAPVYFPIYQGFVDGGLVANNPSLCALAQAINRETGNQQIQDIALLSLGTGTKAAYLAQRDADWGLANWNFTLVDLLFDSAVNLADYQCRQLLEDNYHRLQVNLDQNIGLDAVGMIGTLLEKADGFDLGPTLEWIDAEWN